MPDPTPDSDTVIECPLFPWYSRLNHRYLGLGTMFVVLALWFSYDGAITWPNQNKQAEAFKSYKQVIESYQAAKAAGTEVSWIADAKQRGIEFDSKGEPLSWAAFAARKGWPERPKAHTQAEIDQQFYLAGFLGVLLIIMAVRLFLERNTKLIGHANHLLLPSGERIDYADVFRIDQRKWDDKGLAYLTYHSGDRTKKAVLDDLKYNGAAQVLDRLLANFHGELIQKAPEDEASDEAPESGQNSAT